MTIKAYIDESYKSEEDYYFGCFITNDFNVKLAYEALRRAYNSFLSIYGMSYTKEELKFSDFLLQMRGMIDEKMLECQMILPTIAEIAKYGEVKAINVSKLIRNSTIKLTL